MAGNDFRPSDNDHDWLGPGIYFWEANPKRGLEFAHELKSVKRGPKIETPAVIGAVIDLGLCLDLTTSAGVQQVSDAYRGFRRLSKEAGWPLPTNNADSMRRNLDCALIRFLHKVRDDAGEPPIDSIKGVFIEGGPIYPESGFHDKTHIQICVCNPDCIKGVFRVPLRFVA